MNEVNTSEPKTLETCKPEERQFVTVIQSDVDKANKRVKILKISERVTGIDGGRSDEATKILEILKLRKPAKSDVTNFETITQSPEALAEFLKTIWSGKIQFDDLYCKNDCEDNCHEAACINNWLNSKSQGLIT